MIDDCGDDFDDLYFYYDGRDSISEYHELDMCVCPGILMTIRKPHQCHDDQDGIDDCHAHSYDDQHKNDFDCYYDDDDNDVCNLLLLLPCTGGREKLKTSSICSLNFLNSAVKVYCTFQRTVFELNAQSIALEDSAASNCDDIVIRCDCCTVLYYCTLLISLRWI